jgi:hypothetical protein
MRKLLILIISAAVGCVLALALSARPVPADFGGSVMVGNHLRHEDFRPVIKLYAIPLAKPQDDLVAHVTPDQGSSVWSTPHYALTAFTARHRRGNGAAVLPPPE